MSIFDENLDRLLLRCTQFQDLPTDLISASAIAVIKSESVDASPPLAALEKVWYDSLAKRKPAFSVYSDPFYIAEAWCCWIIYSRKYLRSMRSRNSLRANVSIIGSLGDTKRIVDLGCGFGHTAAAWRELLPQAEVIGTNLPGTLQYEVAETIGQQYGFAMQGDLPQVGADIVFASEYFEHISDPIDHLRDVILTMNPRVMIIANAFGKRAIGHFIYYRVDGRWIHGSKMSQIFNRTMKKYGYFRTKTKLWNQRPALWVRA